MEETDSEIGRPVRKKRLKRVMKAKKRVTSHRLNSSRIHGLCINSSLNSTLLKQTLRTNNRALAKALEMKRQDLNVAQQIIIQLQEEQQHTQQQLSNLQHVAGLKENAIEAEVQLRIQSRMDDTKQVLSKVCMQLLSTVELIHGALDISTSRTSSVCRPATPAGDDMPSACKNVYYHGPPTTSEPKSPQCCTPAAPGIDIVAASAALDRSLGDVELATNMMTGHPDLSVILEQSQFMDAIPIPFTEDEPSEGCRFLPVSRSHSRQRRGSDRQTGSEYNSCSVLTPPLPQCQPSTNVVTSNERRSQQILSDVPGRKSQQVTTDSTPLNGTFEGMTVEEAFGRRDAGRYRADERPLPTLQRKEKFDGNVGSIGGGKVAERSSSYIKKLTKLKRASRVMVSSTNEKVVSVSSSNITCDRRSTFVLRPASSTTGETLGSIEMGAEEESGETPEEEVGILEEFGNILVNDEDDIMIASPDADSKCVGNVAQEQTIYSDEDMEMTGVLNVPFEVNCSKISMPAYINKETAHEPSFLANTTAGETGVLVREVPKQDASKDPKTTETRKVAAKKLSKKTDKPSKHKLTLKKGNSKTSRRSNAKKLAQKIDLVASEDDAQTMGDGSSVSETGLKKFSTYITKPGQMAFTTGKLSQMAPPKGMSMLPRVTARSKSRAKSNKIADVPVKDTDASDEPKSVFDLSMNESVIMVRTKYSDFREHYNTTLSKDSSSDDASNDANVGESPHGIMLTLGNGKRTKPRRARSKQVSYASYTADAVALLSDVALPDDQPTNAERALENKNCDVSDLDNKLTSGDDSVFAPSGGDVLNDVISRIRRPSRKCSSSVVYVLNSPDASRMSADSSDTIDNAEGDNDNVRCSRRNGKTNVSSDKPADEETGAAKLMCDDIGTGHMTPDISCSKQSQGSVGGSVTEHSRGKSMNKVASRRESKVKRKEDESIVKVKNTKSRVKQKDYESILKVKDTNSKVEQKDDESIVKVKDTKSKVKRKDDESIVKENDTESVMKEAESIVKEKDTKSKVKQKDNESITKYTKSKVKRKEDESIVKVKESKSKVKQKEDESIVKEKDTKSKVKQKEDESIAKETKSKEKQKEAVFTVKESELIVKQKESKTTKKETDSLVRQRQVGQRPVVKGTPNSKSGEVLSTEKNNRAQHQKRRSVRSNIVVGDASDRDGDRDFDVVTGITVSTGPASDKSHTDSTFVSCKKQTAKKDLVQTEKHSVTNRKRSADISGETMRAQIGTPRNPTVCTKQRESIINRTSINLPEVSPCKRRRRAASNVNYKEPSGTQKLRQGDPHTASVYVGKDGQMMVPPIRPMKKKSEHRLSRKPLDTITNNGRISIAYRTSDVACV